MNSDDLCYDKNGQRVKVGDTIRIKTCASLEGDYVVSRGVNGALQVAGENLAGFYPGTYEILPNGERHD